MDCDRDNRERYREAGPQAGEMILAAATADQQDRKVARRDSNLVQASRSELAVKAFAIHKRAHRRNKSSQDIKNFQATKQGTLKAGMQAELRSGGDPKARLKSFKERERAVAELEMKMKLLKKRNPSQDKKW